MRLVVAGAWIALAAVVALLALGVTGTYVTGSPVVCGMCHEMAPKVATWRTSAHTQVGCPACHETPKPWYRFPETLAHREVMLARDVTAHFTQRSLRAPGESGIATISIPDSRCQSCHDPSRKVTIRYGTLIDHTEHAERNKSCVSCHMWTGHPEPNASRPLVMMRQCFGCHGRSDSAAATGACGACHPEAFELTPDSHEAKGWKTGHGPPAKDDRGQCLMCHDEQLCRDCHGVEIPHPAGWAEGKGDHGAVAMEKRGVCANCHEQGLDFCSMCHHKGYEPANGPWVRQHPETAEQRGTSFCFDCHVPTYCVRCHTGGRLPGGPETEPESESE